MNPDHRRSVAETDLRLLLPALVGWASVALLLGQGTTTLLVVSGAAACVAALTWFAQRRRPGGAGAPLVLTCLVTALLVGSAAANHGVRTAGPVPDLAAHPSQATIEGTVESDPRILPADQEHPAERVMVRVDVSAVTAAGSRSDVHTPVLVIGGDELRGLRWWEHVTLSGRLTAADRGDDVVAIVVRPREVRRIREAGAVARAAEHVRDRVREAVRPLPADPRGLVPALVIGDRSLTPAELTDDMRATGLTHLSAVSGSNVAIVLAAGLLLCRWLRVPRRARPWVAGGVLVVFVVLARPDPSVLRAAVMGGVGLCGLSSSRRAAGMPALAAAVVVLLVVDPWLARSYGFALSALATLGLLLFARPWGESIAARLPPLLRPLGEATAIPLAAQATCGPVIVLLEGSVTVVGVAANLLAAPFVAPATIAGVLCAICSALWVPAGTVLAWAAALPAWMIAVVAHGCARVPFGALDWPDGAPGALGLAAVTILVCLTGPWLVWQARAHPIAAVAVVVLAVATCWPAGSGSWRPTTWGLVACDAGEADALVLNTGPGHAVVVDAGQVPAAVDRCLDTLGVTVVDALVLTHFHADHVRGMPGVFQGRTVSALYVSPTKEPAEQAAQVRDWAADAGLTGQPVAAGQEFSWGPVHATALWPAAQLAEGSVPNNASVVLDVETPDLRLLLLGDVEREAGRRVAATLRAQHDREPFDVLKVAHHGSGNFDPGLLDEVDAPVAIISVGAGNDYGHPTPKTLDALAARSMTVWRTDRDGDVAVGTEDGHVVVGHSRN